MNTECLINVSESLVKISIIGLRSNLKISSKLPIISVVKHREPEFRGERRSIQPAPGLSSCIFSEGTSTHNLYLLSLIGAVLYALADIGLAIYS
jgi:hypothetical protein